MRSCVRDHSCVLAITVCGQCVCESRGKGGGIASSRVGWGGRVLAALNSERKKPINADRASLPETPTVLYSSISNKSTSVCWDNCERKGAGEKWESKWAKRERDKAQRESLSAANTDTVMHQDCAPCLHHSFEWSFLHMDTLFCVRVLTNQPTA